MARSNDSHSLIIAIISLQVIQRSAIGQFFSLSLATVQQVFAKVNLAQFNPSCF